MERVFEDEFMDIQTEMVQIGLDLVEKVNENIEKIYLLIFSQGCGFSASILFKIGNQIKKWNQVDITGGFDTYIDIFYQREYEQSNLLRKLFKDNGRPCPEELRLIYDLQTEAFDAEYGYDVPDGIVMDDLCKVWAKELRAELEPEQRQAEVAVTQPQVSEPEGPAKPKKTGFKFPFFWKK